MKTLDISLCPGTNCPRKATCLRHTQAPRAKYQAWLIQHVSVPDPVKECRFHISNEEKTE